MTSSVPFKQALVSDLFYASTQLQKLYPITNGLQLQSLCIKENKTKYNQTDCVVGPIL
jgi:hypothetical protein